MPKSKPMIEEIAEIDTSQMTNSELLALADHYGNLVDVAVAERASMGMRMFYGSIARGLRSVHGARDDVFASHYAELVEVERAVPEWGGLT